MVRRYCAFTGTDLEGNRGTLPKKAAGIGVSLELDSPTARSIESLVIKLDHELPSWEFFDLS